jgi:hypothetical protein
MCWITEREYRCLGQWEENGFTYTYTQRRDIGNSYECFVGLIVNKDEIFIKEAGSHCTRFKDITVHGMRLHKRGEGGSNILFSNVVFLNEGLFSDIFNVSFLLTLLI